MDQPHLTDLRAAIRSIPDYPKPGIVFRDITTLLGDARAFRRAVDDLVNPYAGGKADKVAGIEARGFILGGAVAHHGGTAVAAVQLLRRIGADVIAACFVIDLPDLGGAKKLRDIGVTMRTLVSFEGH
jgi:adenine phosphoribosyltransferase